MWVVGGVHTIEMSISPSQHHQAARSRPQALLYRPYLIFIYIASREEVQNEEPHPKPPKEANPYPTCEVADKTSTLKLLQRTHDDESSQQSRDAT